MCCKTRDNNNNILVNDKSRIIKFILSQNFNLKNEYLILNLPHGNQVPILYSYFHAQPTIPNLISPSTFASKQNQLFQIRISVLQSHR